MQSNDTDGPVKFTASADPAKPKHYIVQKNGNQYVVEDLDKFTAAHGKKGMQVKEVH